MRILFFGTAEISVPFLRRLMETQEVVGVVTQPDRPAERGHNLHAPAVKVLASGRGIPVFQPEKYDAGLVAQLKALCPELGIAVSYGRIIPQDVFSLPSFGCFNVHFSLLPKYRGAAPIQWALINGETETGVTTFWIEKGLDTGPVLLQRSLPVLPEDDAETLRARMLPPALEVMDDTVERIAKGEREGRPQTGEPSCAPCLRKEDGRIDWTRPAKTVLNLIRGTVPWPGAYTFIGDGKQQGKRLKILKASVGEVCPGCESVTPVPGEIAGVQRKTGFMVRCGEGFLTVEEVQPENRKRMPAWDFWQGGDLHINGKLVDCYIGNSNLECPDLSKCNEG